MKWDWCFHAIWMILRISTMKCINMIKILSILDKKISENSFASYHHHCLAILPWRSLRHFSLIFSTMLRMLILLHSFEYLKQFKMIKSPMLLILFLSLEMVGKHVQDIIAGEILLKWQEHWSSFRWVTIVSLTLRNITICTADILSLWTLLPTIYIQELFLKDVYLDGDTYGASLYRHSLTLVKYSRVYGKPIL